jgi:hypothetical protein
MYFYSFMTYLLLISQSLQFNSQVSKDDDSWSRQRIFLDGMQKIFLLLVVILMNLNLFIQVFFILVYVLQLIGKLGFDSGLVDFYLVLLFTFIVFSYMVYMREYYLRVIFHQNHQSVKLLQRFKNILYNDIPSPIVVLTNES